jgi:hypothetical protein
MNRTIWVGTAALAVTAALGAGAAKAQTPTSGATPWLHVRVDEAARSSKVSVNLPMPVVEAVLAAAPETIASNGHIRIGCGHPGLSLADMRKIWLELRKAGDTEFVAAEEKDETVKVARKGDLVQIRVRKPGDAGEVEVDVPVGLVDAALAGEGDTVDVKAVVRELQKRRGDIVRVRDKASSVRVWIDEAAGGSPEGK